MRMKDRKYTKSECETRAMLLGKSYGHISHTLVLIVGGDFTDAVCADTLKPLTKADLTRRFEERMAEMNKEMNRKGR